MTELTLNVDSRLLLQDRARKLRIFAGEDHPFKEHPQLVEWTLPPRRLRPDKDFYEIDEGHEPMNPEAYRKRFWHMMTSEQQQRILELQEKEQSEE